ncbi:LCP family protein [Modestobacter sp. NPDC049651]|uniref:LCP family protein n=1 Tax=unclassified Modestobacter TaxID=2643866 RepID=UPI0033EB81B2
MTTSTTTDAGQDTPGRRPPRAGRRLVPRTRRGRVGAAVALLALLLAVALGADAALVAGRIDRIAVDPRPGPGTTWVVVGLDSRADLPAGTSSAQFGTTDQVPGERADVVLVVHRSGSGATTAFSVPRDLTIGGGGRPRRLALTWLDGPQATVDALCRLGIPTDHLATVDLAGFAAVVDAVGGVEVDVPEPVRDPGASLLLPRAGRQRVDGATALAMVRSRHPQHLVDGQWADAVVDPDGRADEAGTVLSAVAQAGRASLRSPLRLQRLAWAGAGAVTVDEGTSLTDLAGLARTDLAGVPVLPVGEPVNSTLMRLPTDATREAVAAAGMSCDR